MASYSYRFIVSKDYARCHVNFIFDDYSFPLCVIWFKDKKFGFRSCSKFLSDCEKERLLKLIRPMLIDFVSE